MLRISPLDAIKLIEATGGKIFHVQFIKRTTGEVRCMTCRKGVTKHLKGGELPYDPAFNLLISVFDMEKQGYRMIPVEGIQVIKIEGEEYEVQS